MRNCTWIAPQVAADEPAAAEDGEPPAPAGKHHYTRKEKERFAADAEFHLQYRKRLDNQSAKMFSMFLRGTEANKRAKVAMREDMLRKLGPGNEELKARLIPSWSPGCRRLTVSKLLVLLLKRSKSY
jgi:hypothetical protein